MTIKLLSTRALIPLGRQTPTESDGLCRGLNISRNKLTGKLVSPFRDWIFIEKIITENKEVPSGTK